MPILTPGLSHSLLCVGPESPSMWSLLLHYSCVNMAVLGVTQDIGSAPGLIHNSICPAWPSLRIICLMIWENHRVLIMWMCWNILRISNCQKHIYGNDTLSLHANDSGMMVCKSDLVFIVGSQFRYNIWHFSVSDSQRRLCLLMQMAL